MINFLYLLFKGLTTFIKLAQITHIFPSNSN